jgi:hypothetical protein
MRGHPSIQIMLAMFLNMFLLIYFGSFKPLESALKNRIELFNEFMICCVTFFILNFTDWVGDKPIQTTYGWVMNAYIFVIIAFNSIFILGSGARSIKLVLIKYKNIISHRCTLLKIKALAYIEKISRTPDQKITDITIKEEKLK